MIKHKRDVFRLENELKKMKQKINQVTEESFDEKILDIWESLKIEAANEKLKSMPVDTISTLEKGMPINVLVNNGLRTIYDIKDYEPIDLIQIDGIGEKSAYPIYESVTKIKQSVIEQTKPRINPDQLSKKDTLLLEVIYKKWNLLKTVDSLKDDFPQFYESISPILETAKKKTELHFIIISI